MHNTPSYTLLLPHITLNFSGLLHPPNTSQTCLGMLLLNKIRARHLLCCTLMSGAWHPGYTLLLFHVPSTGAPTSKHRQVQHHLEAQLCGKASKRHHRTQAVRPSHTPAF